MTRRTSQQQRLDLYGGGAYGWDYRTRWRRRVVHALAVRWRLSRERWADR